MVGVVGIILIIQTILGIIVFFVLRKILEDKLIESTIHELDLFLMKNESGAVGEVVVVGNGEFAPEKKSRIQAALQKRFSPQVRVVYQTDKNFMGGMVLKFVTSVIGKSLKDRLRESGFVKG